MQRHRNPQTNWERWFIQCADHQIQGTYDIEKERMDNYAEFADEPLSNPARQTFEDSRIAVQQAKVEAAKRGLTLDQ